VVALRLSLTASISPLTLLNPVRSLLQFIIDHETFPILSYAVRGVIS
jgi:hypothetical protein